MWPFVMPSPGGREAAGRQFWIDEAHTYHPPTSTTSTTRTGGHPPSPPVPACHYAPARAGDAGHAEVDRALCRLGREACQELVRYECRTPVPVCSILYDLIDAFLCSSRWRTDGVGTEHFVIELYNLLYSVTVLLTLNTRRGDWCVGALDITLR